MHDLAQLPKASIDGWSIYNSWPSGGEMIVSKLEIKGFRGIRRGEICFSKFTTLVGPNNCGKTTITEALALVLGRDRLIRSLTEHDFTGSTPTEVDRIGVIASITGFQPNDPANHTDWFRWGRGTIKWLDVDTGSIRPRKDKDSDLLTCQIAFAARFDQETLEVATVRYFYDANVDPFADDATIEPVPFDFIRKIGFFLVPAVAPGIAQFHLGLNYSEEWFLT